MGINLLSLTILTASSSGWFPYVGSVCFQCLKQCTRWLIFFLVAIAHYLLYRTIIMNSIVVNWWMLVSKKHWRNINFLALFSMTLICFQKIREMIMHAQDHRDTCLWLLINSIISKWIIEIDWLITPTVDWSLVKSRSITNQMSFETSYNAKSIMQNISTALAYGNLQVTSNFGQIPTPLSFDRLNNQSINQLRSIDQADSFMVDWLVLLWLIMIRIIICPRFRLQSLKLF